MLPQSFSLEDEILAVIYYPKGKVVITRSDIKPGLDGSERTLKDIVIEMLMVCDKIMLHGEDEGDIERYLVQLQKQHGLGRTALENMFSQLGYSYEEGREELRRKHMIDSIIDFRVRQDKRMLVSPQEVQAEFEKNPLYSPMTFVLQQAFIPFDDMSEVQIKQAIADGTIINRVAWEDPFDITEDDLSEDKLFIKTATVGSIVEQESDDDGIEITRLIERKDKQIVPFEVRSSQIELELRKERYYKILKEYQEKLLQDGHIVFIHEADKQAIMNQ